MNPLAYAALAMRIIAPTTSLVGDTGSMFPLLRGGDAVQIVRCPFQSIQPGQVVVVWWPSRRINVIHRVIAIRPGGALVTKGDANIDRDAHITTEADFCGCVTVRERGNKNAD